MGARRWTLRKEAEFADWIADGFTVSKAAELVGMSPEEGKAKWKEIVLSFGDRAR